MIWKDGYRSASPFAVEDHEEDFPYITSIPADLFMFVLRYLLDSIGADEELLPNLILAATGKEYSELPEIAQTIIENVIASQGNAIAALTELMDPVEYEDPFKEYVWRESAFTYGVPALEASDVAYLKYANNWTEAKAEQLVEGSGALVETLMAALGQEGTLGDMLSGLIGGALNNETIASLKDTLAGLGDTLGDAAGLLNDVLGVDLGAFAAVEIPAFEDGDVTGFFNALKALLAPLSPVIAILFGEDFSALDGVINIKGYDTYPESIQQLFDALGIEQIDDSVAAEDMLGAILDAIGTKVDSLLASENIIKEILGLLPNVVYFLESEGLGTALFNLLVPIQIVLDVIRPIYDLDLSTLIAGLLAKDEEGGEGGEPAEPAEAPAIDLESLTLTQILGIVDGSLGTTLAETPLASYAIPALYADKTGDKVGDFTSSISEADTLTILLSAAVEAFMAEASDGKTNGEIIIAKIAGDDAEKQTKFVGMYNTVIGLLTAEPGDVDYTAIDWDYMYDDEEIRLDSFTMPDNTVQFRNYVLYSNNWNKDVAGYVDENLDDIVSEVVAAVKGEDADLGAILQGLIEDNLYTDDVANALISKIGELISGLDAALIEIVDLMLDTDLHDASFEPVSGISDRESFINAVCGSLAPVERLLAFALFGEGYTFLHHSEDGSDLLALNGGYVYDAALVPVLEALGVAVPAKDSFLKEDETYDAAKALRDVLTAVADRLDVIAGDVVTEALKLLPNILYFINAGGLKAAVSNALAPFDGIVRLVTGNEEGALIGDVAISDNITLPIEDLTMANIMTVIENALGIEFTDGQKQFLPTFYIGAAEKFDSVNGLPAFRMVYRAGDDANDRRDMITILVSFLLETLRYEDNINVLDKLPVEGLDGLKAVLNNIFNLNAPGTYGIQWYNTDAADTETIFSPIESSTLYPNGYGLLYTEEMAQYIADNFECFIDDMIELLGVQVDGEFVESLPELLESYIGVSIFTTENLVKIADALKGYVGMIDTLPASAHIKEVVKRSLGVDIDAFMNYVPGEANDKDAFLAELNNMFTPFAPLFRWLLCDESISFFCDSEGNDQITLFGAEGYKYGIIPILEALFCEDIVDYESFKALGDDELIPAILGPIFTKLDFILEDPAERIFEILPNVAYFINSKGLDACVKNITGPVQKLLDALEPMIGEVSVEKLLADKLGVASLGDINVQLLLEVLLVKIEEGTELELESMVFDAVAELTTGKVESFTSLNGEQAYRMVYAGEKSGGDMATTLMRIVLRWIATGDNAETLKAIIREKVELPDEGYAYTDSLIDVVKLYCSTDLGVDQILHSIYYVFYGLHTGSHEATDFLDSYNGKVQLVKENLGSSRETAIVNVANLLDYLFTSLIDENASTGQVLSEDGFAPNGIISFFKQLVEWFKTLFARLKLLFNR